MSVGRPAPGPWHRIVLLAALTAIALLLPAPAGLAQEADASIVIAKAIPGDSSDPAPFTASLAPCKSPDDAKTFTFAQNAPVTSSVAPGCWQVEEVGPASPYAYLGWAFGTLKKPEGVVCPPKPDHSARQAVLEPSGGEQLVVCFYNDRLKDPGGDPPRGDPNLLLAKVVPGNPSDSTPFSVVVSDCREPVAEVTISQPVPTSLSLGTDRTDYCLSESPNPAYTFLGWAIGTVGERGVVCPDAPTDRNQPVRIHLTGDQKQPQVVCFYNQYDITSGYGRVVIAKVIPGYPSDITAFSAHIAPCTDTGVPSGSTPAFTQDAPAHLTLPLGCWQASEHAPPSGYRYLGYAISNEKEGKMVCPESPQSTEERLTFDLSEYRQLICFYNERLTQSVANLTVAKVVVGDPDDVTWFSFSTTPCDGDKTEVSTFPFSQPIPFESRADGCRRFWEDGPPAGYRYLGWALGVPKGVRQGPKLFCPDQPTSTATSLEVTFTGEPTLICFYNEPLTPQEDPSDGPRTCNVRGNSGNGGGSGSGNIRVNDGRRRGQSGNTEQTTSSSGGAGQHDAPKAQSAICVQKVENVVGFEHPGAGWEFTLTGCGVQPRTGVTGDDGYLLFDSLPPALDCTYTVTETLRPGWTPQFASRDVRPQPGEVVTLTFLNIRDFNPPCFAGCVEPPPADDNPPPPPPPSTAEPPAPQPPPQPSDLPPAALPPAGAEPGGDSSATTAPPPAEAHGILLPPSTGNAAPGRPTGLPVPVALLALLSLGTAAGLATVHLARRV